jgi:hypothetical protein
MAYQTPQLVLVGEAKGLVLGAQTVGIHSFGDSAAVPSCQDPSLSRDTMIC